MQNNRSLEKELGARFSMACSAKAVKVDELADAIGIDREIASKFETEGISDINMLLKINEYLGIDLLCYRFELSLSEMAALKMVVDSYGYIDVYVYEEFMEDHGCTIADLEQLLAMHLCIREQFADRNSETRDGIFLSEAGKNWATLNCWVEIEKDISFCGADRCLTYEDVCDGYENYQTYVNNKGAEERNDANEREWIKVLREVFNEAEAAELFADKLAVFDRIEKLAIETANEYGFTHPNVLLASVDAILNELERYRNDEKVFSRELYRANCMIDILMPLYGELNRCPIYRVYIKE